jgi:hypothetical protein
MFSYGMDFNLQVTVHIKGQTECYECQPKPAPKSYPVCTITSTPSKVRFPFLSIMSTLHLLPPLDSLNQRICFNCFLVSKELGPWLVPHVAAYLTVQAPMYMFFNFSPST